MGAHIFMDVVRWFGRLFHKNETGNIDAADAIAKGQVALNTVLTNFDTLYKPSIELVISDEGVASIEMVEGEIRELAAKLEDIQTLEDIPEKLKDVRLADDDKRNTMYHTVLMQIATAMNDGKLSVAEVLIIVATILAYFKKK